MMLLHLVLGMLEMLVDGLLEIRDMESHAEANEKRERNKNTRKWIGFDCAEGHLNNLFFSQNTWALCTTTQGGVLRRP